MAHKWKRMTSDGIAVEGPCILYMVGGDTTVSGDCVTVYDGLDPDTGRVILNLDCLANRFNTVNLGPEGILITRGIYVDLDDNGEEVLIVYESLED